MGWLAVFYVKGGVWLQGEKMGEDIGWGGSTEDVDAA